VLFDELPADFDADDINRACVQVAAVETASVGSLHVLGEALYKRGVDLRQEDDRASQLLMADGLVCQLWLGNEASVARWGGAALIPMMEKPDGVFPPPVVAFPAILLPYVARRADVTTRPDAQARYLDFLWLHRRSYVDARAAVDAYRRAGVGSDPADATGRMDAASYLIRAAEISMSLNFERAETAEVLIRELREAVGHEGGGFIWQIAQKLGGLAGDLPEAASLLLDELVAAADAAKPNPSRERTLRSAAEAVAGSLGRRDAVDAARRAEAESFEREAAARAGEGAMIELALLRDALRAFERIGDGTAIQRLKDRYGETAMRATTEMTPVSADRGPDLSGRVVVDEQDRRRVSLDRALKQFADPNNRSRNAPLIDPYLLDDDIPGIQHKDMQFLALRRSQLQQKPVRNVGGAVDLLEASEASLRGDVAVIAAGRRAVA
jgi:hypothetical protein